MAFDESQKVLIRLYLGFPDVFRAGNPRLEGAIEVIGGRPETQALVESILANLVTADSIVNNVALQAGIKKVDEIEFFPKNTGSSAIGDARAYGRMLTGRLSAIFGIIRQSDVFSDVGYVGDEWSREGFQYGASGGGGGVIPLG